MKSTTMILSTILLSLGISSAVMAETVARQSSGIIAPYGDNPNLAHVLVYKAQENIIEGAEKVSEASRSGFAKVKPSLNQAWGNTKNLVTRGGTEIKNTSQGVAANISEKIHNPKDIIHPPTTAEQSALQQQSLNQKRMPETDTTPPPVIQTPNTAQVYAVTE